MQGKHFLPTFCTYDKPDASKILLSISVLHKNNFQEPNLFNVFDFSIFEMKKPHRKTTECSNIFYTYVYPFSYT